MQNAIEISQRTNKTIEDHDGSFAIESEFGYEWLKRLIHSIIVEWI
jgi:hypothetical protein